MNTATESLFTKQAGAFRLRPITWGTLILLDKLQSPLLTGGLSSLPLADQIRALTEFVAIHNAEMGIDQIAAMIEDKEKWRSYVLKLADAVGFAQSQSVAVAVVEMVRELNESMQFEVVHETPTNS